MTARSSDRSRLRPPRRQYLGGVFARARAPQQFDPLIVQPWRVGDGPRGVLLLHGFAGSPPELRRLGNYLASQGWRCYAPALAGHATTTEAMAKTGWRDWVRSARHGIDELMRDCTSVAVVGQSMGGTIALHLAATDRRVGAVATLAAPLRLGGPWPVVLPWMRFIYPWHSVAANPLPNNADPADQMHSYVWRSNRTVVELFRLMRVVRGELGLIRAPVLIIHGGADRTIDPRNSAAIARGLTGSAAIQRIIYSRSDHGLSVGVDRDNLTRRVDEWFARYCPRSGPEGEAGEPGAESPLG